MSNSPTNRSVEIFSKFSLLWAILPYFSRFEKWSKLLNLLCKDSKRVYNLNTHAFENLSEMTDWNTTDQIESLLKAYHIDPAPKFDEKYELKLDWFNQSENVIRFISEAQKIKFRKFKNFEFSWMQKLESYLFNQNKQDSKNLPLIDTSNFFTNSITSLQVLHLQGCNRMKLSTISEGLSCLLPKVHRQVIIYNFAIDQATLQSWVFANSYNCKELVLRFCFIEKIDEKFVIDSNLDFQISSLNLFMTARENECDRYAFEYALN